MSDAKGLANPRDDSTADDPPMRAAAAAPATLPDIPEHITRAVRAKLAAEDPELLAAVGEVDRTLIRSWLQMTPWERAERCYDMAAGIEELRAWRRVG